MFLQKKCLRLNCLSLYILQKTVDCMTTMSVPSTLVKCLYLFFDLPHMPEVPGATQPELPLADRRALLQKVFVQVRWLLCQDRCLNSIVKSLIVESCILVMR